MKLFILWFSLLGASSSFAQVNFVPAAPEKSKSSARVSNHRFLSASNTFLNQAGDLINPFYVQWYLTSTTEMKCDHFDPRVQFSDRYSAGFQYVDGLSHGATITGFLLDSDLKEAESETGAILPEGNYCLWSSANYSMKLDQIDNYFVFETPICYGSQCPENDSKELVVYPNPANAEILFEVGHASLQTGTAIIFDLSGRTIKSESVSLQSGAVSVDISSLAKGEYILSVINGSEKSSAKFLKQ